ncbi:MULTISPECIES: hypothetical protein [unclassified Caballeronia]|jgi:hypothetical protein|uniref:hypothetical protein n=1 Tax=unclassified Caballeronia TaxID=2646786 RepID=UPI00118161FB|nr:MULTISPECIES: hypothetical protein [unclassified Caballeronia]
MDRPPGSVRARRSPANVAAAWAPPSLRGTALNPFDLASGASATRFAGVKTGGDAARHVHARAARGFTPHAA